MFLLEAAAHFEKRYNEDVGKRTKSRGIVVYNIDATFDVRR